ncbi:MAG: hypothetical protein H0T17_09340 [Propionibacteriales bacterium]|nr:hypothetical protein [Propionibacteriales bacterium]
MTKQVFLHVGAPKTGTTYLQDIMLANRDRLVGQGVLYVGTEWTDHVHANYVVREHPRLDALDHRARGAWRRLVDEALGFDGRAAVISHEFLGAATTEQAGRAIADLAPAEVHLVLTARAFVNQVPAVWQEHLKYRATAPLGAWWPEETDDPLSEWSWRTIDPVGVLGRWAAELDATRVHVVTTPPDPAPPDVLWHRYAAVIGVDADSCELDVARRNESLGVVEAELLRRVNAHVAAPIRGAKEVSRWIRGNLVRLVLAPRRGRRFGIRDDRLQELHERARQAIGYLRESGYDISGDLEDLDPPPATQPLPHPDDVADDEVLAAATESIAAMLQLVRQRTLERDRAREELRERRGGASH